MRLDNAAKIYPAAKRRNWNNFFRISATLAEPVDRAVLAAALDFVRQLELAAQDTSGHLDYQNVMAPDLQTFCHMAKLPAAPNALSDAGYMFTLSGADLIRDIYAYCSELAERSVFGAAEVKPGYVIKLVLRLFLMDGFGAMPA